MAGAGRAWICLAQESLEMGEEKPMALGMTHHGRGTGIPVALLTS